MHILNNTIPKVAIVGASPDRINRNTILRSYVYTGFASILGHDAVAASSLEAGVETVRLFKPDVVLCFGSCMPDEADYGPLRDVCDEIGAKLVFWLHDDPYEFDYNFRAVEVADVIFSNDSWASKHYSHQHVYHLPLAGCPSSHIRPWNPRKNNDVFFCGVAFTNRIRIIWDLQNILQRYRTQILGADWPANVIFANNRRLSNVEISDSYANSFVTLNMGRNLQLANQRYQLDASTPGPRTFEAALAGTVQMYFVDSLEITRYFTPGEEILLFDNPDTFRLQLEMLLDDPEKARSIAEASRTRALNEHTYATRAMNILHKCGFTVSETVLLNHTGMT